MLALKASVEAGTAKKPNVARASSPAHRTLIFDEIDTGIGGRAAEAVGKKLKALSRANQVLCVTHLPQIATFADHHYLIEKKELRRSHSHFSAPHHRRGADRRSCPHAQRGQAYRDVSQARRADAENQCIMTRLYVCKLTFALLTNR